MIHVILIPDLPIVLKNSVTYHHNVVCCQESEARTELLRQKSRGHRGNDVELLASSAPQQHINFFEDLEQGVS